MEPRTNTIWHIRRQVAKRTASRAATPCCTEAALATERTLWTVKVAQRPKSFWYPFSTLHNVAALEKLSAAAGFQLLDLCRGPHARIADIGAADGDLAFFLEKQGLSVDVIDNEYTNFNGLEGARTLKEALSSSVVIRSVDLDSQFSLTGQKYDVIFFLGTLYHLKNPYFVLESLARMTKYCFVSTRIAKQTADGQPLSSYPLAYLLGPQECNADDTNFWIFSDHGLKEIDRPHGMEPSVVYFDGRYDELYSGGSRSGRACVLLAGKAAASSHCQP